MGPRRAHPFRPEPLWIRVDRNRLKAAAFVVLFVLTAALSFSAALTLAPGLFTAGFAAAVSDLPASEIVRWTLVAFGIAFGIALVILGVWAADSLMSAETRMVGRLRAEPLPYDQARCDAFRSVVDDMAIASGLSETPALYLVQAEDGVVNAFAFGRTRRRALLGVTGGLLHALAPAEQRAVVASLLARVRSGDVLWASAYAALIPPMEALRDATGGPTDLVDPDVLDLATSDGPGGCMPGALFAVWLWLTSEVVWRSLKLAAAVVVHLHRRNSWLAYEKADAEGMLLLKEPEAMLTAISMVCSAENRVRRADIACDGVFFSSLDGRPGLDGDERRRIDRLREVLGVEGGTFRTEQDRTTA